MQRALGGGLRFAARSRSASSRCSSASRRSRPSRSSASRRSSVARSSASQPQRVDLHALLRRLFFERQHLQALGLRLGVQFLLTGDSACAFASACAAFVAAAAMRMTSSWISIRTATTRWTRPTRRSSARPRASRGRRVPHSHCGRTPLPHRSDSRPPAAGSDSSAGRSAVACAPSVRGCRRGGFGLQLRRTGDERPDFVGEQHRVASGDRRATSFFLRNFPSRPRPWTTGRAREDRTAGEWCGFADVRRRPAAAGATPARLRRAATSTPSAGSHPESADRSTQSPRRGTRPGSDPPSPARGRCA